MMLKTDLKPSWSLNEFDKTLVTATYFGFTPVSAPRVTTEDLKIVEHCGEHPHYDAVEKAALIRHYNEQNLANLPHPLAIVYRRSSKKRASYNLHFIGSPTAIAEASLIRTALSMLSEEGYKNMHVDLNCIGDKDSISTYERELINYLKKSSTELPDHLKQSLKQDIWNLFHHEEEEMIQLRSAAPSSISFLTSQSRLHFKEVLEFLEALSVDFRLAPELVGEKHHASHTVFAIKGFGRSTELEETLAVGYRYSRLTKKFGFRKELPMVGVTLFTSGETEKKVYKTLPKPKFYLVQLGREAKMKTLSILEHLRINKIPVHHFLGKDKLTAQLMSAEALGVSHLIIIGHKEALDGTATIRNMQTRAQDTIPMEVLPQYLKNISL
jgi:histidyl-tRNA synthetase